MKNFTDYTHKNQYRLIKGQFPPSKRTDVSLLTVIFLMAGNENFKNEVAKFVNWIDGVIEWDNMLNEESFNEDIKTMIKLSAELHFDVQMVTISDLITKLDSKDFSLVLLLLQNIKNGLNFDNYSPTELDSYI